MARCVARCARTVRSSWRHMTSPTARHILGYLLYMRLTWPIAARSVGSKEAKHGAKRLRLRERAGDETTVLARG